MLETIEKVLDELQYLMTYIEDTTLNTESDKTYYELMKTYNELKCLHNSIEE